MSKGTSKPNATAIPSEQEILATAYPARATPATQADTPPEITLALDLSTTCVGWALGADSDLVNYGKFVFKTTATIGEKVTAFADFIQTLLDAFHPTHIVLERPVARGSTVKHFELLGVLRYLWMKNTGKDIPKEAEISPATIKKHMHVQHGKNHDHNKEIMVNAVNQRHGLRLKYHRNSAYQSDDDTADAIAVFDVWRTLHYH